MDTLQLLFNAVTFVFIAVTMFAAGLGATTAALRAVFTDVPLLLLALLTNLVVIPLLGWGVGAMFGLATGPPPRRTTLGGVAAVRNAGPALAGIAFDNDPAILGALAAVLLSGLAAALPIATVLNRRRAVTPQPTGDDQPHTPDERAGENPAR